MQDQVGKQLGHIQECVVFFFVSRGRIVIFCDSLLNIALATIFQRRDVPICEWKIVCANFGTIDAGCLETSS